MLPKGNIHSLRDAGNSEVERHFKAVRLQFLHSLAAMPRLWVGSLVVWFISSGPCTCGVLPTLPMIFELSSRPAVPARVETASKAVETVEGVISHDDNSAPRVFPTSDAVADIGEGQARSSGGISTDTTTPTAL